MALPSTSGVVSNFPYTQRQIIEHAYRRAGLVAEKISGEDLTIAQELIYSTLGEWVNAGFPLWTKEFILLPITIGSADVPTPVGTVDVIHSYWRIFNPYRGPATGSDGSNCANLFGGQPNADITVAGANPGVAVNFTTPTELDTIGVLLGGSTVITAALNIQTSPDGVTWTTVQALPSAVYTPMTWTYFDLNPSVTSQYVRLQYVSAGSLTLNQINFGLANGTDTMNGPLNIDDYYNLPNKQQQSGRAVSTWVDRQLNEPVIKIWETPNVNAFYNGTISALVRRYMQDPGQFYNAIEIPPRAIEALQWRLAAKLMFEIPDRNEDQATSYFTLMAKTQRMDKVEAAAAKAEALFWAEERSGGPIKIVPNIRGYTR